MAIILDSAEQPASSPPAPKARLPRFVFGRNPRRTFIRLGVLILVSYVLLGHMLIPIRVTGISMYPTYRDGEINFINRWSYRDHEPQRGDVVAVRLGEDGPVYLKRIIAMPGEKFAFVDGWLVVDGEPMVEPYVFRPQRWWMPAFRLKDDEYYVVGDNRSMHISLHAQGIVRRQEIAGKVLF